jgi:hypothetical protein
MVKNSDYRIYQEKKPVFFFIKYQGMVQEVMYGEDYAQIQRSRGKRDTA